MRGNMHHTVKKLESAIRPNDILLICPENPEFDLISKFDKVAQFNNQKSHSTD